MKDLNIKKILTEFSKIQTKFFEDPPKIPVDKEFLKEDKKRRLMEVKYVTEPPEAVKTERETVVQYIKSNPNLKSVENCITGQSIVSPKLRGIPFEKIDVAKWTDNQQQLYNKQQENWFSACKYYYESKVEINYQAYKDYKRYKKEYDNNMNVKMSHQSPDLSFLKVNSDIDYDQYSWETFCITSCFYNRNQFKEGCAESFTIDQNGREIKITLTHPDWWSLYKYYFPKVKKEVEWFRENEKFINQDGWKSDYSEKMYGSAFWWERMPNFFSDEWQNKMIVPSDALSEWNYSNENNATEKLEKIDDLDVTFMFGLVENKDNFATLSPYTQKELEKIQNENPYNPSGSLKLGQGKYICKKEGAPLVQLRDSAEVNEEGAIEKIDNWIGTISDTIIGKHVKTKNVSWEEETTNWNSSEGIGPRTFRKRNDIWYLVELIVPFTDVARSSVYMTSGGYEVRDNVDKWAWVSSQTTEFCKMTNDGRVSGQTFQDTLLMSSPMISFKNPSNSKLEWSVKVVNPGLRKNNKDDGSVMDHMWGQ